jgi:hypothetical protein
MHKQPTSYRIYWLAYDTFSTQSFPTMSEATIEALTNQSACVSAFGATDLRFAIVPYVAAYGVTIARGEIQR